MNRRLFPCIRQRNASLPVADWKQGDPSLYDISAPAAFRYKTVHRAIAAGIIDLP